MPMKIWVPLGSTLTLPLSLSVETWTKLFLPSIGEKGKKGKLWWASSFFSLSLSYHTKTLRTLSPWGAVTGEDVVYGCSERDRAQRVRKKWNKRTHKLFSPALNCSEFENFPPLNSVSRPFTFSSLFPDDRKLRRLSRRRLFFSWVEWKRIRISLQFSKKRKHFSAHRV